MGVAAYMPRPLHFREVTVLKERAGPVLVVKTKLIAVLPLLISIKDATFTFDSASFLEAALTSCLFPCSLWPRHVVVVAAADP